MCLDYGLNILLRIALTVLYMAVHLSVAVAADSGSASWIDPWREATVALGKIEKVKLLDPDGKEVEKQLFAVVGTGVLFVPPGQVSGIPWLVTAKHVFSDPTNNWSPDSLRIRFSWFDQKPIDEYLGIPLNLTAGGKPLWISDNDPNVDLAAIRLAIPKVLAGRDSVPAIPPNSFVSPDRIYEGARVTILGYPSAVGPRYWTRALLRSGAIAWVDPAKPAEQPLLIDASVYPGNSGGPVFREPTGMTRDGKFAIGEGLSFLGIVSQGRKQPMPLTAGGQKIQMQGPKGSAPLMSESWMQIGVVEPASRVLRLLERAANASMQR